ncbi:MAG: hypothetical protein OXB98_22250 [Bryobacterales bacterium]|nr:hypothetical protein [Bryobacterales bacterium]
MTARKEGPTELKVWWHGVAALPEGPQDHAYYALRRVWADHTMAGPRGFYRPRSEDHLTPALFQNFALFSDFDWLHEILGIVGGEAGKVARVRWAYLCEERLDAKLQRSHGRNFIIPDILVFWEDDQGEGLIGFEVKRHGGAADAKDSRKLESYVDLPSTRGIDRRYGCLLVCDRQATRSLDATNKRWPVLTWERVGCIQQKATYSLPSPEEIRACTSQWIARQFMRYGIDLDGVGADAPESFGARFGTKDAYDTIENLRAPGSVKRFLKGSECVEAAWQGHEPESPMEWLKHEPTAEQLRGKKWQTTEDRRVRRWHFGWSVKHERNWT